jgi:prolyl oligopeptidase
MRRTSPLVVVPSIAAACVASPSQKSALAPPLASTTTSAPSPSTLADRPPHPEDPRLPSGSLSSSVRYPATRRDGVVDVLHGVPVPDPYRWLEDGSAAEVKSWMRAQDALARSEVAKIPVRDALAARLEQLAHREQQGWGPARYGQRLFYARRPADHERMGVYVRDPDGSERLLLDPDAWAPDGSLSLGGWYVSWDGERVVYQVRRNNADAAVLRVVEVATGRVSEVDVIDGAEWPEPQWNARGDGFYYQWLPADPALRATRFSHGEGRFHKLGDDPRHDVVVRPATPGRLGTTLQLGKEGRWLFAEVHRAWGQNDLFVEDLRERRPAWRTLSEGRDGRTSAVAFHDTFFIHTTVGAPKGRIFRVDARSRRGPLSSSVRDLDRSSWRLVVPEADPILAWDIVGGRLVVQVVHDVLTRVDVYDLGGTLVRTLPSHGVGSTTLPWAPPDCDEAYYKFESYDRAPEVWRTSIATGQEALFHRDNVPADLSRVVAEEVFYASKDGTRIPMFVVHPKDAPRDGSAPTLLYGYGAANDVTRPYFRFSIVPWLERGGVYAIAHIRGGGDYGEAWHKAGNLRNKQNTFDDFAAAAEYLVRERFTTPERLAVFGASWGGLLVTATLTQRPGLFRAAIAEVPQTDMIRFPLTGLGTSPLAEFGDPSDPEDFRVLFAYSPYHHVTSGTRYPAVIVTAAEADERVDPLHARKFVAAMQAASTGGPILMRVDWSAGHLGTGRATDDAERRADEFAFVLDAMGLGGR